MERTWKRFLSLAVALVMVLSMVPANVFAADQEEPVITLPDDIDEASFGENTVFDGETYYATVKAALAGIHGTDKKVLYCRPGADVGAMTHGHVCADLTVYGNGAYLSGGEQDFEVDSPAAGGTSCEGLKGDITLKVINLSGASIWGGRVTAHTVNAVFENCRNMGKIMLTGTTGVNNITLTGCTFTSDVTTNSKINSNAPGSITLTGCTFSDVGIPVNINNKSAGTQTITIDGCSFEDCSAASAFTNGEETYAAPIRVVNSGTGTSAVTVKNCTFDNPDSLFGDILIGDGRDGKTSNVVTLAISGTKADVTVHAPGNVTAGTAQDQYAVTAEESKTITNAIAMVDSTGYTSLQAAVNAADGKTVTLLGDVVLPESVVIPAGTTVTLELNNKIITNAISTAEIHLFDVKGALTVQNGNINSTNTTSVLFYGNNGSTANKGTSEASLVLTNLTVNTADKVISSNPAAPGWNAVTVTGGNYTTSGTAFALDMAWDGTVVFDNVTAISGAASNKSVLEVGGYGKSVATVTDCTLTSQATDGNMAYAVGASYGAKVTINGGTYASTINAVAVHETTYNGGTVPEITIVDGVFNGKVVVFDWGTGTVGKLSISGGSFDADVSKYVVAGNKCVEDANGRYNIVVDETTAVAAVDGFGYTSLAEAIANAEAGDTIILLADLEAQLPNAFGYLYGSVWSIEKSITLDGNGHKITIDTENWDKYDNKVTGNVFNVGVQDAYLVAGKANDVTATIKNLTIEGNADYMRAGINAYAVRNLPAETTAQTKLILENVSISNCGTFGLGINNADVTLINCTLPNSGWGYAIDADKGSPKLTVESGSIGVIKFGNHAETVKQTARIEGGEIQSVVVMEGVTTDISITGGTFGKDVDIAGYVAEGYCVKANESTYVVGTHNTKAAYDETNHYETCDHCGAVANQKAHQWDEGTVTTAPSCTAAGEKRYSCECGATKTEGMAQLNHTEEEIPGKAATCKAPGLTVGKKCSKCGETLVAQTEIPQLAHTEVEIPGKAATCKAPGLTAGKMCSVCETVTEAQTEIPQLAHTEVEIPGKAATCTETGLTAGKMCSVCETVTEAQTEIPQLAHTEVEIPGKAATCTETGLTAGKMCSVCETVTVAQTIIEKHAHTEEEIPGKASTCTETGLTAGKKCSKCGETIVAQTVIEKLAHTEEEIPGKAATCTETGLTVGKKCSKCGETIVAQTVIEKLAHTEEEIPGKAATCTETGLTAGKKCSKCGETIVAQTVIEKLAHTEEEIPGKAATCTEAGLTAGKKCSKCGETIVAQTVIEKLAHTEEEIPGKAATCTEAGLTVGKNCSKCGETIVAQTVIEKLAHTEEEIPGKAATCTEAGLTVGKKCSVCGEVTVEQTLIEKLPHVMTKVESAAPNCTGDGNVAHWHCSECDKEYADELGTVELEDTTITKTGHSLTEHAAIAVTCTEDGLVAHYHCVTCGKDYADNLATKELDEVVIKAIGHEIHLIKSRVPTYAEEGNLEHFKCANCGTLYADAKGETVITDAASLVVPKLIPVVVEEEKKVEVSTEIIDTVLDQAVADAKEEIEKPSDSVPTAPVTKPSGSAVVEVKEPEVVIQLGKVDTKVEQAQMPAQSVEKVAEAEASLTVSMTDVKVTLDSKTLDTVSKATEKKEDSTVTLKIEKVDADESHKVLSETQQAAVEEHEVVVAISASLVVESTGEEKSIHDFEGGKVTVQLPFELPEGSKSEDFKVLYIDDNGKSQIIDTDYVNGHLVFTLDHFSEYVVINDPVSQEKPVDPNNPGTGDGTDVLMLGTILFVAAMGLVALVPNKKRWVK